MNEDTNPINGRLADDLLTGATEIADFIGWSKRQTFYMLEKKQLPAFKFAGRWCLRKSTLYAHIAELEAAARTP